jgi:hypothetical protein
LYDVDFVAGSALDLFYDASTDTWNFDFATYAQAQAASQALLDALPPSVDTTPWLMYGIEQGTNPDGPQEEALILTPYENVPGETGNNSGQWNGAFAVNKSDAWVEATHSDDEVVYGVGPVDTDYFPIYNHIFADWHVR